MKSLELTGKENMGNIRDGPQVRNISSRDWHRVPLIVSKTSIIPTPNPTQQGRGTGGPVPLH